MDIEARTTDGGIQQDSAEVASLAASASRGTCSTPVPLSLVQNSCVHELFEAQVERTPDAVAVVFEGARLTYRELNARSNQLAHYLRAVHRVGPEVRVAICLNRSLELVVAVLAVLKAGGAYVPLEPEYPLERRRYMLSDSAPRVVLTASGLTPDELQGVPIIQWSHGHASPWEHESRGNVRRDDCEQQSQHLAYVIYTSGSTGQPKGVLVAHQQVTRLFAATAPWFGFGEADVWALSHSVAFDFSVWELWGALLYGGRLVVVPQATVRAPDAFYDLLCRQQVTVLNQTPSAFRQVIAVQPAIAGGKDGEEERRAPRLRYVILGGEALDLAMLGPWFSRNAPDKPQLINMYGITETTVHVTCQRVGPEEVRDSRGPNSIGVCIPDLQTYVLDQFGTPTLVGAPGELYVGGAGVARGYLNRPGLTAERFVPDPFGQDLGARLYRTGDRVRWLPNGTLEYLGRTDHQVKVRGYRIELGEIEAVLTTHPTVQSAVALVREDEPGDKRLVAYYISVPEAAPEADELRGYLSERLPSYMVPAAYVRLGAWPLTPNSKVDRQALPVPETDAYASREYEAPIGEVEEALAALWASVLKVERVGRHDDFFALGGSSLLVVTLIERLRQSHFQVDVLALLSARSVAALAATGVRVSAREVEIPSNLIPRADLSKLQPETIVEFEI